MDRIADLERHLDALGRVLLGYSGGVDSALLAVVARRALGRERFLAVIGRSASYPEVQWRTALEIARRFDLPLEEVATHELDDPRYLANPVNRCFYCKQELWGVLDTLRQSHGFDVVVDGTNASDLGEHRPGMAAAARIGVRSPLADLGWEKAHVREAARTLGIPIWDAPAAPCLSSRVAYGTAITPERLAQVEAAEAFLRALGFRGDLRVRHHDTRARVEVAAAELPLARSEWPRIESELLRLGFGSAELDPAGYRRGSLLVVTPGS